MANWSKKFLIKQAPSNCGMSLGAFGVALLLRYPFIPITCHFDHGCFNVVVVPGLIRKAGALRIFLLHTGQRK